MSDPYQPENIEEKWQKKWEEDGLYRAEIDESKPKHYALTMLPYPSGDLHIGHWYAMAPSDVRARYMRMKGYNVMTAACDVCGNTVNGEAPDKCPICGAPRKQFSEVE